MKKEMKRWMIAMAVACFVVAVYAIPVAAHTYSFSIPDSTQYVGSLRYTPAKTRTSATAYVYPDKTFIATRYYLSPSSSTTTNATAVVSIGARQKRNFTWYSGYGGKGGDYRLCGFPDPDNVSWNAYTATGTWVD